jgi:amino acid adenylation domain-containing protein
MDTQKTKHQSKNIEAIYPLSSMQQGILFHTLYSPEAGLYIEQYSCTLEGQLKVDIFERAWQQVVERHGVLRTLFVWENRKEPLQIVRKTIDFSLDCHDWQQRSPREQQEEFKEFLQAERDRGFKLNQAPLMRCTLIQLADKTYQLVWSFHHLLLDAWCVPLIFKEVFAYYNAFCEGKELYLETPRPYRDYISWLRQQDLSKAETFWRQTLQGVTAPTPLGGDKSATIHTKEPQSHDEQHLQLSQGVTAGLQSLARQHRLTLNTLVQGAWAVLLSRYSGESDVIFGATVSGRPPALKAVESMVGLFINTLPVRVQVPGDAFLIPWLKQLQAQQVELEQYSYSPLVEIQGWSEVSRLLPLFESLLVFENIPVDAAVWEESSALAIHNLQITNRVNYPLNLLIVPGSELSVRISYDGNRFQGATIRRMLGHLKTLLEGMRANPKQRLSELPLLTEEERHQILVEWNDTQADCHWNQGIHHLFEMQVAKNPDRVAAIFEQRQMTYAELNARSNQLACYLQQQGVKSNSLVGIYMERSLEVVVGILGLLKAGCAYLPLDPSYPRERLAFMLADAHVSLLLTQQHLREDFSQQVAQILCLDKDWPSMAQQSSENPVSRVSGQNLAYVIYTSGSTGKPKGVMVTHANLSHYVQAMEQKLGIAEGDLYLHTASFAFSSSVRQLMLPLCNGAGTVITNSEQRKDPLAMFELIKRCQVTVADLIPSYWRSCINVLEQLDAESRAALLDNQLRLLLSASEPLSSDIPRQWRWKFKQDPDLVNMYGQTETTGIVSLYPIAKDFQEVGIVPLGRPISRTEMYLLDRYHNPVPVGVAGDLYIGGSSLAQGYLNAPELFAERFIPHPFRSESGPRLYKTGDIARYRPDGNLEYVGRADYQVKIRGFRIELGEIEAVLAEHPHIRENVVVAWPDQAGNDRLVAYIVLHQASELTASQLRNYLKEKLPEYMIPSVLTILEALPSTPNGKVDRQALPAPEGGHLSCESTFVPPRTSTEKLLAEIWSEVLGLERVGIYDNFLELGGHSLLAIQVISRVREALSLEVPLRSLFESLTIAEMSQAIEQFKQRETSVQPPAITSLSREARRMKRAMLDKG